MASSSRSRWAAVAAAAFLSGVVWITYGNSLRGPFQFDDFHVVPQNPAVRGPGDIPSFFTDVRTYSILPANRDWRPIFLTSMALCWWVGGGSTLPFHIVSVLLHMGCVLMLFGILRRTLSRGGPMPAGLDPGDADRTALLAASIYGVHPLASHTVNYISAQSVLWAALFTLGSFHLFLVAFGRARSGSTARRALAAIGSLAMFACALMSKPIAIALPLVLLLWEAFPGRPDPEGNGGSTDPEGRPPLLVRMARQGPRLLRHIPYWALSAGYILLRRSLLPEPFGDPARDRLVHFLTQTKAMVFYYLRLALFPLDLNVDPEIPLSTSVLEGEVVASILVLIGIAWVLCALRRERWTVFWSLWFPACLLLTSYVVVLGQIVNEHRVYLSLAGFSAVAGILLMQTPRVLPLRLGGGDGMPGTERGLRLGIVILILASLAWGTRHRNETWSSELALWEDAAEGSENWRAHMNYALALDDAGRPEEALREYQRAHRLSPIAYTNINLGLAYVKRGQVEQGLRHLQQAVRLWPELPDAHIYLGYGLARAGRPEEAEAEYRKALDLRPDSIKGHRLLAEFYEGREEWEAALRHYETLRRIDPGQEGIEDRIARVVRRREEGERRAMMEEGLEALSGRRYRRAVRIFSEVHERRPDDPEVIFSLAFAHQKLGQRQEAIRLYEDLVRAVPDHVTGHFNLAHALLQGETPEEWERSSGLFGRVVEMDPDYTEALFHRASALWKLGREEEARRLDRLYLERGDHPDLERRARERLEGAGDP